MLRNARKGGPAYSDLINDSFSELSTDLSNLSSQWNSSLTPLLASIPSGAVADGSDLLNAFSDGLDGKTLYVDQSASPTSEADYYNTTLLRPNSVKDQFEKVYDFVDSTATDIREEMSELTGALTETQKSKIGLNIFYPGQVSSAASLDGLTAINKNNLLRVARDLYGEFSGFVLDGEISALYTNSIRDHITALLGVHNGTFDSDLTLSHAGMVNASDLVGSVAQTAVSKSTVYSDIFAGTPANLQEDLNQIRTQINAIIGNSSWTSIPLTWDSQPASLKAIAAWGGSGTKGATNPWGIAYSDLDDETWQGVNGLLATMTAVKDFTGMSDFLDDTPGYSSTHYVSAGTAITSGVSALDGALYTHASDTLNPHSVTLAQAATAGGSAPASQVSILDTGLLFDALEVEAALAEVKALADTNESSLATVSGDLSSHTGNLLNPHQVTAAQLGASGILSEIVSNYATGPLLPLGVMPTGVLTDSHIQGGGATIPSGEHWGFDVDCSSTILGSLALPSDRDLDTLLNFSFTGAFRRLDVAISGVNNTDTVHVNHNQGLLPIVQVLEQQAEVSLNKIIYSGVDIVHSGYNDLYVTNNTGSTIETGTILLQW